MTAAICDCGYSDVDIFLVCGLSRAREILELIYASLAEMVTERYGSKAGRLLVTRSKHAVTTVEGTKFAPNCGPRPPTRGGPPPGSSKWSLIALGPRRSR